MAFPDCAAVTEQIPAPTGVSVAPETVQTDEGCAVYEIASPELAVALSVSGGLAVD